MIQQPMETTARALAAEGKGILAADENLPTIAKRFNSITVQSTKENRRYSLEMEAAPASIMTIGVCLFKIDQWRVSK